MGNLMRTREALTLMFAAMLMLLGVSSSDAATFSTAHHPQASFLSFDFYAGNPLANPGMPPLGMVGPTELSGAAELDVNLDALGDGSIQYLSAELNPDDLSGTLDLGALGTLDFAIANIHMTWATALIDVASNDYMALFNDDVSLIFDAGTIVLGNASGALADVVGTGTIYEHDYGLNPHTAYYYSAN